MAASRRYTGNIMIFLIIVFLTPVGAGAEDSPPYIIRASIGSGESAWVGQLVPFQIDVLGRNGWAKLLRNSDIRVPGAVVVQMESQGVRLSETMNGETYTGQRYEILLFPQRSGRLSVPPVNLDIEISRWGAQTQKEVFKSATPEVSLTVQAPPGTEAIHGLISTDQLAAEQNWEPDADQFVVGEAIQRTIDVRAGNISAMAIAPLRFSGPEQVGVYPRSPEVEDQYERGTLTCRRTERVTYVFKGPGKVELPAISITWWDLKNRELRDTVLPPRVVRVAAGVASAGGGLTGEGKGASKRGWYIGIALAGAVSLLLFFRKQMSAHWSAWREARQACEKAFFNRFVKAARSGQPANALNALMQWLDRLDPEENPARLDRFVHAYVEADAAQEVQRLIQALYAETSSSWEAGVLVRGMAGARRKWKAGQRSHRTLRQSLPMLNP